jgi:hypothetical protein
MKRLFLLALSILVLMVLAGCGKAPDAQMRQATAALQAAEAAGAPQYAPDSWSRAKQAVDQMKAELDKQNKRFALFRSYGKVKTLAAQAVQLAEKALADANTKKTQLRNEVTATIADLYKSLDSARRQLARLPRIRNGAALKSSLNTAERQLGQARADLAAGALDNAMAVAAKARDAINNVLKAIEAATGGSKARKK